MTVAVRIGSFGGPEVLELVELPHLQPPDDGVVLEVRAVGVNPIDWKVRKGLTSHGPLMEPIGLGSDASGVVVSVGAHAGAFAAGDAVLARGLTGAYATHVTARASQLVRKPASVSWEEAAALGMPAATAYQSLKSLGAAPGETLLVHAGSGAVGQAAVQFAHLWGLRVVATASAPHHSRLIALGAIPVAYGDGLLDRIRAASPGGIDIALDAAGTEEALDASVELVADRSRIATLVAFARAAPLGIRAFSEHFGDGLDPEARRWRGEALAYTVELVARGDFQVEIAQTYPLEDVAAAHRHSESGHVSGKIVLVPTPGR